MRVRIASDGSATGVARGMLNRCCIVPHLARLITTNIQYHIGFGMAVRGDRWKRRHGVVRWKARREIRQEHIHEKTFSSAPRGSQT